MSAVQAWDGGSESHQQMARLEKHARRYLTDAKVYEQGIDQTAATPAAAAREQAQPGPAANPDVIRQMARLRSAWRNLPNDSERQHAAEV